MSLRTLVITTFSLALLVAPVHALGKKEQINTLEQEIAKLQEQVTALEAKTSTDLAAALKKLEQRVAQLERKSRQQAAQKKAGGADKALEQQASAALQAIYGQVGKLEIEPAKAQLKDFFTKYSKTRSVSRARTLEAELSVVGLDAPADYQITKWFQGESEVQITSGKPTVLIFWEVWCPHCRREVPKIQKMYETYGPKGVQIVGLTKVNKNRTDADVTTFLEQNKVGYPIAKESGAASRVFKVRGVPAAAVVKDGKIIWRGHPSRLTNATLDKLL